MVVCDACHPKSGDFLRERPCQKPLAAESITIYVAVMSPCVYLMYGEDEYLVSAKAQEIVNVLVPAADRALGLEVIDGMADTVDGAVRALSECIEALQTVGLCGNRKAVWLRDVNFFTDNAIGVSEAVKSRVGDLTSALKAGLLPQHVLIVTSSRIDKRSAFYKTCKERGEVDEFSIPDKGYLAERQAAKRVGETLSRSGLRMKEGAFDAFLEKVGTDTRQIVNEIEKLDVFTGERKVIQLSDVETVTSSSRNALTWDLADAVGRRDLGRALEVLRQLMFQKESSIGLIIGLENRIRDLTVYREALDKGWLSMAERSRGSILKWEAVPAEVDCRFSEEFNRDPRTIHPYRAARLAEQANLFSMRQLSECRQLVMDAHVKLVSSSVPQLLTLELLLIRMLA